MIFIMTMFMIYVVIIEADGTWADGIKREGSEAVITVIKEGGNGNGNGTEKEIGAGIEIGTGKESGR